MQLAQGVDQVHLVFKASALSITNLLLIIIYFGMHFPYVCEEFLLRKSKGGHGP